tara:strand:+ start:3276 stop:3485 length:210 start_codon:yes stop_codon:yes gene_type:complete
MSLTQLKELAIENELKAQIINDEVHITGENFKMFVFKTLIIESNIAVYQGSYSEGFFGSPVFQRFVPSK